MRDRRHAPRSTTDVDTTRSVGWKRASAPRMSVPEEAGSDGRLPEADGARLDGRQMQSTPSLPSAHQNAQMANGQSHQAEVSALADSGGDVPDDDQLASSESGDATDGFELHLVRPEVRGDVGPLIDSLHALFEHDRAVASQTGATRCGICYLHFAAADMSYRQSEGFYVCEECARALGPNQVFMVRRQQR